MCNANCGAFVEPGRKAWIVFISKDKTVLGIMFVSTSVGVRFDTGVVKQDPKDSELLKISPT